MMTAALALARDAQANGRPERISYGPVELEVTDLDRSVQFWSAALGLIPRESDGRFYLGTQTETLVILHPGAARPAPPRRSGLYHVALGVPDQQEFSRLLARLIHLGVPIAPVDHVMSKAIYLQDPDGLGIEIAYETPARFGRFGDFTSGMGLYDATGRYRSGRDPLDVRAEVVRAEGVDLRLPLAEGSHVAHLHLHVPDLESAATFFERIGFVRNLTLPQFGFADLGAGGAYTHRIAINVWQGRGAAPAPPGYARMRAYSLRLREPANLSSHSAEVLLDPAGIEVRVSHVR